MSHNLPEVLKPEHPIFTALKEIQKPRSRFQLEKFVVGQHDTDEQKYKQCLLEIQQAIYAIQNASLEMKKTKIQIEKLKSTGDEIDAIDAEIKELGLNQTQLVMMGARRELDDLIEIWESFPIKYSYDELENSQPEYWSARLTRQAQLEALGSDGKVGWASLDALRQVGTLQIHKKEVEEIQ